MPGDIPAERTYHTLTIETSDPAFKTIRIPIMLQGPAVTSGATSPVVGPPER